MINKINKTENNNWLGLTITDEAAKQICSLIKKYPDMIGIRVNIKKYGCAGLGYTINKVITPYKNDLMFEYQDAKLFVPIEIMPIIDGTKLDFIKEGLHYTFKFNNPKAQFSCGCGESFTI